MNIFSSIDFLWKIASAEATTACCSSWLNHSSWQEADLVALCAAATLVWRWSSMTSDKSIQMCEPKHAYTSYVFMHIYILEM